MTLRRRALGALGVIALLLVLVPTSRMLLEALFYPWARSFGLRPVLVGTWHGEMEGTAGESGLFLEIRSTYLSSASPRHLAPIGGRLRWCDGGATIRDYTIRGDVESWRGERFRLAIDGAPVNEPGLSPDELAAEWRGDTIEAEGTLWRHGASASAEAARGSSSASARPRMRGVLRRGGEGEFEALCGRLAPRRNDASSAEAEQ